MNPACLATARFDDATSRDFGMEMAMASAGGIGISVFDHVRVCDFFGDVVHSMYPFHGKSRALLIHVLRAAP